MQRRKIITAAIAATLCGASASSASPSIKAAPGLTGLSEFNGFSFEDAAGNLYGSTSAGGSFGDGIIFKYSLTTHVVTTLANPSNQQLLSDQSSLEPSYPVSASCIAGNGNLFGYSTLDGNFDSTPAGYGYIYEYPRNSSNAVLVNWCFNNPAVGTNPTGLICDSNGNLYGTAATGGPNYNSSATNNTYGNGGYGTVFKIAAGSTTPVVIAAFNASNAGPANLVSDARGDLFGITTAGQGSIFEIASGTGSITTLASFNSSSGIVQNIFLDPSGNIYGMTYGGGTYGYGTVFKISAGTDAFSSLASFPSYIDEGYGSADLVDAAGDVFGTEVYGGASSNGFVFEAKAGSNTISDIYDFGSSYGSPYSGLYADTSGNLYGAAGLGGAYELSGTGFAVPEPSGMAILLSASPWLVRRRSRRAG